MKVVQRLHVVLLVALVSFFLFPAAPAQEIHNSAQTPAAGADQHKDKDADKEATPVPPEKPVATHHELALGGKTLKYTATAGDVYKRQATYLISTDTK